MINVASGRMFLGRVEIFKARVRNSNHVEDKQPWRSMFRRESERFIVGKRDRWRKQKGRWLRDSHPYESFLPFPIRPFVTVVRADGKCKQRGRGICHTSIGVRIDTLSGSVKRKWRLGRRRLKGSKGKTDKYLRNFVVAEDADIGRPIACLPVL